MDAGLWKPDVPLAGVIAVKPAYEAVRGRPSESFVSQVVFNEFPASGPAVSRQKGLGECRNCLGGDVGNRIKKRIVQLVATRE